VCWAVFWIADRASLQEGGPCGSLRCIRVFIACLVVFAIVIDSGLGFVSDHNLFTLFIGLPCCRMVLSIALPPPPVMRRQVFKSRIVHSDKESFRIHMF